MKEYIIDTANISDNGLARLGGKGASLARLSSCGLPIPSWFAVTNDAFFDSLTKKQKELFDSGDAEKFAESIKGLKLEKSIADAVTAKLGCLETKAFAVRSSALSEDSGDSSFAGQFETYLWVSGNDVPDKIMQVFMSAFAQRVIFYRSQNGMEGMPEVPTVLIQKMVKSEKAGVCFCIDPVSVSEKTASVSAVYGLGSSLVDGEANADVYNVSTNGIVCSKTVVSKNIQHVIKDGVLVTEDVASDKKNMPVLSDEQASAVAALARTTSKIFGRYQDIEWAFCNDELYLLQSRPITTINVTPQSGARTVIFDNSNIAESYGNVTMPLTASFIAFVYQEVYKQFCALFGISKKVINENSLMFKCMLGFRDGRVYYNLLSWYQMLAIMPFYKQMSELMERMMGVTEPLPGEFMDQARPAPSPRPVRAYRDIKTVNHFLYTLNHLDKNIDKFYASTKAALDDRDMSAMSIDELYCYYYELADKLIANWGTPLANDFFTMVFHGTLEKLCEKWCTDKDIHNDLLCGQGGIVSAEPAKLTRQMADSIRSDKELCELLATGTCHQIETEIAKRPDFQRQLRSYMDKFSDRCMDELKLESDTLTDDPILLYRSIGALALKKEFTGTDRDQTVKNAEAKVKQDLAGHAGRKAVFGYFRKNAKKTVKNRENLRFERTRVFGKVRRIFVEIGIRLCSRGVIDDKRDIFFLTVDEIMGFIDGTGVTYDLRALVNARKAEYNADLKKPAPPRRFAVHGTMGGAPAEPFTFADSSEAQKAAADGCLKGLACCPGLVTGIARVVTDPTNTAMKDGEILVAQHTDPGWITLFSMASALVVERGSLLSHAAIVSREMGIPAVVSVDNATAYIKDGDTIRVNGMNGTVEILGNIGGTNEQ